MFSTFHIIMLLISIVPTVPLAIFLAKGKISTLRVIQVCMILGILSEFIRATYFTVTNQTSGNVYLQQNWLPFQLCSIQIIFLWVMGLTKNEKTREKLISFFIPTAFWGGVLAILIPTTYLYLNDLHLTNPAFHEGYGTWHRLSINFFVYHGMLLFLAIFFYIRKFDSLKFKEAFINCFKITLVLMLMSIFLNAILQEADPNFFFTAGPPIEGLPLLNLNNGWSVYILALMLIGVVKISLTYLPVYIKETKAKKK